ncbi:TolC family protein [Pseudazoarcus pumilus]|uniref:TolC family protein n=1 Tax=Pseudazoarcus pumilus TaxID=2067960 RepID=A0A2I6S970_9RHOO|nr:TolC family protein [Pseudazoarcus pumilus]AUN95810.1 TolC family protein [Pseudazoarcus pumilus]
MTRTRMLVAALAAALGAAAHAAPPYDPAAAVPPPRIAPLPGPASDLPALGADDWREANDRVGAMPRGHMDVLRWEARNLPQTEAADVPPGEALTPGTAVRMALAARPDLATTTATSELDRRHADAATRELARDVYRAWIGAVVAQTALAEATRAFEAVDTGDELATRMTRTGTWSQDRLLRSRLARADALAALVDARTDANVARAKLASLLGLWGEAADTLRLPDALPALPDAPPAFDGLETRALQNHPELPLAAREARWAERGMPERSLQVWREAVTAELPAADTGLDTLPARAPMVDLRRLSVGHEAAAAARDIATAEQLAVRIRNDVRAAWLASHDAWTLAREAQARVVPLTDALQDETLLRYNGMLASTWEVLDGAAAQAMARTAAHDALGRFWLAHTELQNVLAGGEYAGPESGGSSAASGNTGGH